MFKNREKKKFNKYKKDEWKLLKAFVVHDVQRKLSQMNWKIKL